MKAKEWAYEHGDNTIVIRNNERRIELLVNNQVQDTVKGFIVVNPRLFGALASGEKIIASIEHGKCSVFVGNELEEVKC